MPQYIVSFKKATMCDRCYSVENRIYEIPFEAENDEMALEKADEIDKQESKKYELPVLEQRTVCKVIRRYRG